MKKALMLIVVLVAITPIYSSAQQPGTFVGSLGMGIPSAQGDFGKSDFLGAGSGFGVEGEIRFYVLQGFAIGAMGNWMRFGTSLSTLSGHVSYNFDQIGATARLNLIPLSNGTIFVNGGGGIFKPNAHFYVPDASSDLTGPKSGVFGFGGIGISSPTNMRTMYELELRYNIGRADIKNTDFGLPGSFSTNSWDFLYLGVKLSFASKGKEAPSRY